MDIVYKNLYCGDWKIRMRSLYLQRKVVYELDMLDEYF